MEDKSKYFVVKQKAVPEVLQKVVEAKRLLETERAITVQEATDRVGISRVQISCYLHGTKMPALDTLANLCKVLDVDTNYILCQDLEERKDKA